MKWQTMEDILMGVGNHRERKSIPITHPGQSLAWLGLGGQWDTVIKTIIFFRIDAGLCYFDLVLMLSRWKPFSCHRPDPSSQFKLAIGSYVEQYSNVVSIIKKNPASDEGSLYKAAEFDHPYPCTKIMWTTDMRHGSKDLLATTGDYLRVWNVSDDGSGIGTLSIKKEALLNNNKTSEYCAPLTSFDWNETDPSIIGTSSIDTTCTIWDVTTQQARTQLIAHDREVL
jgi:hypothetical protein